MRRLRRLLLLLVSLSLLCSMQGALSARLVTLASIEIFNPHEWFSMNPIVYFRCRGENMTVLPDVKKLNITYTFKGVESWQPLTELPGKKCKRCGLYERDTFKPDDVYDEWELCSDEFVDGKYVRSKDGEFLATFVCNNCSSSGSSPVSSANSDMTGRRGPVVLVVIVSVLASVATVIGMVVAYKYWQKRKREQDQARFLKLFDEGDEDFDDELGLGRVI